MATKPSKKLVQRATVVMIITCLLGFGSGIFGLVNAQLINAEEFRLKAESQQLRDKVINAERGTIYDKNMNILSQSANVWKIYMNPSKIKKDEVRKQISNELSKILDMDYETVYNKASKSKYGYVTVKSQVDNDKKVEVKEYIKEHKKQKFFEIIGIDPDTKRYYPYINFASTVLGFTGADDDGRSGLEYYYNKTLTGVAGRIITAKNAKFGDMPTNYESTFDAKQGTSLVLTIDQVIQYYLDKGLEQAVKDFNATYGYGVVMDVKTGAILAMSTKPDFDPNKPYEITNEELLQKINEIEDETERDKVLKETRYSQWRNRTISDSYEPGSVFKVITSAAGIEENMVQPDSKFNCRGSIRVADRTMHCHKRDGHGPEDFTHALMNSCNPIFIEVAQRLGPEKFYKYFEAFGFTEPTGIDLPAESKPVAGVTYHERKSLDNVVQLASSSFGQSFQVSPIQMISAISAIGNGGQLMKPYIVGSKLDENGNTISATKPEMKRQVVSKETASKLAYMMEAVATAGTGKNAYVAGYKIAGKTGTSQKLTNEGKYIGSFAGFAPSNDPRIAVLIVIDEPTGGSYGGGLVAAPVAAEIFRETLQYLNVEPQYTAEELAKLDVKAPKLIGKSVEDAKKELSSKGFKVKVIGSGEKVVKQTPDYNQILPKNGLVVIYTDNIKSTTKTKVPKLTGLTLAEVNRIAVSSQINIKVSGYTRSSDIVSYRQSIQPDEEVSMGTIVTVSFKCNSDVNDFAR